MFAFTLSPIEKYIDKVAGRAPLPGEARTALMAMSIEARSYRANEDIVREGDRPTRSCLVDVGLVSRFKTLRNGVRQILSFHLPGEMVDLQSALVVVADHGIRAHIPTRLISFAHADILAVAAGHPAVARAFWFDTLLEGSIFREWTFNVGRRDAKARTAHLLLEFAARMTGVAGAAHDTFTLPVSQSDLSDALGMTSVHLNRTLQWLRGERLIRTHSRSVTIENRPEMVRLAGFDPVYLHPEGPRQP